MVFFTKEIEWGLARKMEQNQCLNKVNIINFLNHETNQTLTTEYTTNCIST